MRRDLANKELDFAVQRQACAGREFVSQPFDRKPPAWNPKAPLHFAHHDSSLRHTAPKHLFATRKIRARRGLEKAVRNNPQRYQEAAVFSTHSENPYWSQGRRWSIARRDASEMSMSLHRAKFPSLSQPLESEGQFENRESRVHRRAIARYANPACNSSAEDRE